MPVAHRSAWNSVEDYVRLEAYSNVKHEYFEGQIFAMGGGTPEHGARAARVIVALGAQLRGKLEHYKQIPTLREILLVGHERACLEVWRRDGDTWTHHESETAVDLDSVGCVIACADVFHDPLGSGG